MYFKEGFIRCVFMIFFITTVVSLKKDKFYCEMSSPCVCVTANNDKLDLASINNTLSISTNVTLYYQPCPDNDAPDLVAIQIVNVTANTTTPLAYYTDVQFEIGKAIMLVYKNNTNEFDVVLSCDPQATIGNEYLTNFQNVSNHYEITLKTSKVCNLNLMDSYENNNSNSWSVLLSVILVGVFIYFVGGSVVNACLYNETGTNMIPHHEFWISNYNKIKEKLCGASMMASAYESI